MINQEENQQGFLESDIDAKSMLKSKLRTITQSKKSISMDDLQQLIGLLHSKPLWILTDLNPFFMNLNKLLKNNSAYRQKGLKSFVFIDHQYKYFANGDIISSSLMQKLYKALLKHEQTFDCRVPVEVLTKNQEEMIQNLGVGRNIGESTKQSPQNSLKNTILFRKKYSQAGLIMELIEQKFNFERNSDDNSLDSTGKEIDKRSSSKKSRKSQ